MGDAAELRKLAEWYRAFSAVGRTDEREGRLRLAEYLDAKAAVKSADELRAEVRRLLETINKISDSALKQELAGRAFLLAQEAEQIEELPEDPNFIRVNIDSYRRRLSAGIDDPLHKQIIEELLRYA